MICSNFLAFFRNRHHSKFLDDKINCYQELNFEMDLLIERYCTEGLYKLSYTL